MANLMRLVKDNKLSLTMKPFHVDPENDMYVEIRKGKYSESFLTPYSNPNIEETVVNSVERFLKEVEWNEAN